MDDAHGKEINLVRTTVKIPGGRPRGSVPAQPKTVPGSTNGEMNNLSGPGTLQISLFSIELSKTGL